MTREVARCTMIPSMRLVPPRGLEGRLTTDLTAIARRVLAAINDRKPPEDGDVALLRAYYPDHSDCDPDELACIVIQEGLKARMDARQARSAGVP